MQTGRRLTTEIIFLFLSFFFIVSCFKEESGPDEIALLDQYLRTKGYADVEPTNSGLYHIIKDEGYGNFPRGSDFVIINYTASFVDNMVFDTSYESIASNYGIKNDNKLYGPAKLLVEKIAITGLAEGVKLMKEGGRSKIIIPSHLAYGKYYHGRIPPYSTLVYDVELVKVIDDPDAYDKQLLDIYLTKNEIIVDPTESGLYYIETKRGGGNLPQDNQIVTFHYKGSLLDGRVFVDSENNEPMDIKLDDSSFMPGIIEGLKKMRENGKALLIIPWEIGYGSEGSGDGLIPPYTTIVFEIELHKIRD